MKHVAIDGTEFGTGGELDLYSAGLDRLQEWADRMAGTIGVDRLKQLCRERARTLASQIRSSV